MNSRVITLAVVLGVIITLGTGLLPNTPAFLVGAEHFGYPFAWLIRMVVAPEYFPWNVDFANLILDIILWTMVIALILLLSKRMKK